MFNRKAFTWGAQPSEAESKKKEKVQQQAEECPNRIYEVVAIAGVVRAEPFVQAKMKTKKSKGGRVICSEMTMNGWLKLEGEPGWLAAHMRGVDGIGEVAIPCEGKPINLAVPVYQSQGMCCFEVVCKTGAAVREKPSKSAAVVSTRKCGEYVFAKTQNFDGWIRLSGMGDEGWMLASDAEHGRLLARRRGVQDVDLWALCDAWAAARSRPGPHKTAGMGLRDIQALKELEERLVKESRALFDEHVRGGNPRRLVHDGLLEDEELRRSASYARQRIFARLLLLKAQTGEAWIRELLTGFSLTPRVQPLPGQADDEDFDDDDFYGSYYGAGGGQEKFGYGGSGMGSSFGGRTTTSSTRSNGGYSGGRDSYDSYDRSGPKEPAVKPGFFHKKPSKGGPSPLDEHLDGTRPFEYNGKTYAMAANGVVFDPPNQVPMGIWNPDTRRIDPAAGMMPGCPYPAISYMGKTFILLPDHKLLDPETEEVIGSFNPETNELELDEFLFNQGATRNIRTKDKPLDPVFDDGEPVDVQDFLKRGEQMCKAGRYRAASGFYTEALKGISKQKAVDVDLELEILRNRCKCWKQLGCHKELLEDAERILSVTKGGDKEAEDWRRDANDEIVGKSGRGGAKSGYPSRPAPSPTPQQEVRTTPAPAPTPSVPERKGTCSQCNGLSSKCAQCGAGMERCAHCAKPVNRSNCCSRCHCTYYCGRDCQRAHWKVHKLECTSALE